MSETNLNIKSSTIEKGIELAKEFLSKLVSPTVEEVGLLISDNIKFIRFKNQIKILLKAQKYVEEKNLKIKEIPIKILVPLLENASLEEDEELQDKWASMLTNMVDSDYNLQNHIFPYLLGQISKYEFEALEKFMEFEKEYYLKRKTYYKLREKDGFILSTETKKAKEIIQEIEQKGLKISLDEYEYANLTRLGLLKQLPPKIYIDEFKTTSNEMSSGEEWHTISAEYDHNDFGYRITELGELFLDICDSKK